MKVLISFDESSHVEPHSVDINILPRPGDFFDLPDVGNAGLYPVMHVIFLLTRPQSGGAKLEVPTNSPQVRIQLGPPVEL